MIKEKSATSRFLITLDNFLIVKFLHLKTLVIYTHSYVGAWVYTYVHVCTLWRPGVNLGWCFQKLFTLAFFSEMESSTRLTN